MRKKIIAGNWKMNNDLKQTDILIKNLVKLKFPKDVRVMISPAFPFLKNSIDLLSNYEIEVISQNINHMEFGAYTGEVSVNMLKSIGIKTTLIGHSERRVYFNENDSVLNKKIDLAIKKGMGIIFCFGEQIDDRSKGNHFDIVKNQLLNTVLKLEKYCWEKIILAYEPVWAIGTGETATPEQAQEMHFFIRNCIRETYGKKISDNTSILYGGSVKPSNALEIFSKDDVDGGLIGGASLNADDFYKIVISNSSL